MKRRFALSKLGVTGIALLWTSCSSAPPKPTTPSLTPDSAYGLLHYNNKAENWLTYVRKNNPSCTYQLELPDQSAHPTTIDLDHIVVCGGRPSPKEFDASVSFAWDPAQQRWVITRFSS